MGALDCDCIENLMGRFEKEQKTERIQNAIRHIRTSADIDPWAMDLAVEALESLLSAEPKHDEKDHQEQGESAEFGVKTGETCADAVSRQAAVDALMVEFKRVPTTAIRAKTAIEQLPSVQPKPDENTRPERGESAKFGSKTGETCADTISRQAALDEANEWIEAVYFEIDEQRE